MPSQASYDQRTGSFIIYGDVDDGGIQRALYGAQGYAGRGVGKNNPDAEHQRGVGPLPVGRYDVVGPSNHERLGPFVFRLQQVEGPTYGRSGFFIHGDSRKNPGEASSGCIILSRHARDAIARFDVRTLEVCASQPAGRVLDRSEASTGTND